MAKTRAIAVGLARKLEFTGERTTDQAQRNQHETVGALNRNPITPNIGTWVKAVSFTVGKEKLIVHGLGRPISGWLVTRAKVAAPRLYEVTSDSTTLTLFLENGFSDCTVDLWVF